MQRIPEPEDLMNDAAQAQAYAEADFSEPNTLFVELLEKLGPRKLAGQLLDLGCGPADIPLQLAARHKDLEIDAVDGAAAMLDRAQRRLDARPDVTGRVRLLCEYLPCPKLPYQHYRYIVSNSLLHHLEDPLVLWQTVKHSARPGAVVLAMDLARPASTTAVDGLVETYAIDAPEILRRDFRNSLFAAYTIAEVQDQLSEVGLGGLTVNAVSDRHLAVQGQLPF